MSMKKFNYKHICGLLFLFVVLGITIPTKATASTTPIANGDSSLVKKRSLKERLTPNTVVAQYAGNIGCVSVGLGWESLSKRSLTEAHIGYVPHYQSTQSLTTFTLRQKGVPMVNSSRRGDLIFCVNVEIPKGLSDKQKDAMRAFADSCGESNYAKHKQFFKKIFGQK